MSNPENMVPFPLAGEGAHLRFRTADYVELRNKYGEPKIIERTNSATGLPEDVWETFTDRIEERLRLFDPITIVDCLRAGLKTEDGRTKFSKIDWNDLSFPLVAAVGPIQDAMVLALTNQPYAKLLAEQRALAERNARLRAAGVEFNEEAPGGPDPSMPPTMSASSGVSSGSDTPPA